MPGRVFRLEFGELLLKIADRCVRNGDWRGRSVSIGASSRLLQRLVLALHRFQINPLLLGSLGGRRIGIELSLKTPEHLEHALLLFGEFTNEADLVFAQALLLLSEILARLFQLVFEEGGRTDRLLAACLEILVNE